MSCGYWLQQLSGSELHLPFPRCCVPLPLARSATRTNFPTDLCVWDWNRGGGRIVPKGNGSKNTDENSIVPLCMNFILSEQITLDWYYGVLSGADPLQDPLSLAYFRSR